MCLSSFSAVGVDDCLGLIWGVVLCRKASLQMAVLRADPWGSVSSEGLAGSLHAAFSVCLSVCRDFRNGLVRSATGPFAEGVAFRYASRCGAR